jgi:hypothetical protein
MLINLIALKKIDRSPRVAFEAALKSLSNLAGSPRGKGKMM